MSGAAYFAMGAASSNSAFIGFPMLLFAAPEVAGVALALNTVVEYLAVIPLFLFLAEGSGCVGAKGPATRRALSRILMRRLIIGPIAGVLVSSLELELPEAVSRAIGMVAEVSFVLTLFVIGGTLTEVELRRLLLSVSPIVLATLILHRLFVWFAIAVAGIIRMGILLTRLTSPSVVYERAAEQR